MPNTIDLHMHTNHSDGALSTFDLIKKTKEAGLTSIAITDHDSVNAFQDAYVYGKEIGVEVIPGVEISTDLEDKEIHLLGYFINVGNDELTKYLSFFREERFHRAKRIINKLRNLGMKISIDDVLDRAKNSSIGRPHIANTMTEMGLVKSFNEAFEKYIGDYGPAYERKIHVSPHSALKLINEAGGLSFLAHPGFINESILLNFIKSGIDGIEVIHPQHSSNQIRFYRGIVNQYCLLESGGSDFHGGEKNDQGNLGKYVISQSTFETMKKMLGKK
jgi:3',5'-nucleoside bisphosphate phosphatase